MRVCAEQLLKLAQGVCKGDSAAVTLVTDSSFIVAAGAGMLEGCAARRRLRPACLHPFTAGSGGTSLSFGRSTLASTGRHMGYVQVSRPCRS